MNTKYKATILITSNSSDENEARYVIKDMESGEIVDDAQGYGYKSARKAYAGWADKSRDKSRDAVKAQTDKMRSKWMKENKQFIRLLDTLAFEMWKNNRWTEDKVDAKFVRNLLEEQGYGDLPFTAGELLKYWQRGPLYSKKKR